MATGYSVEKHYDFGQGIYRQTSPIDPKFPDGAVFNAMNMVYDGDTNNLQSMYGSSQLGSALPDVASGLFDHDDGSKLLATCEDGKIYQCDAGTWNNVGGARKDDNSRINHTRWYGGMFYGAATGKELMILCNGIDAPIRYDTSNGAVTLGGSPLATGNFPASWQNRLWMASGSTLAYSAVDDCEDWSTAGGGGTISVAAGVDGPIVGIAAFANHLLIFKRNRVYRIPPTQTFSSLNIQNLTGVNGLIAGKTLAEGEMGDRNVLTWMSGNAIEAIGPSGATGGFEPVEISRWIEPLYDNRNISGMATAWSNYNQGRKELYGFIPWGTKLVPSRGFIGNLSRSGRPPRWTQMNRNNLTCGVTFNGDASAASSATLDSIQYCGDNDGKIYRMHDKSTAVNYQWDGSSVLSQFQTKYYLQNAPGHMKRYGWTFISADKIGGNAVNVNRILLRQGLPVVEAGNEVPYNIIGAEGWGEGKWGVEPWGGSGIAGERIRMTSANRGTGLSILVSSNHFFRVKGVSISSKILSDKIAA